MLKSSAFANEEEWRLISHDVRVDGNEPRHGVPLAIKFRASGGRVVPYFDYTFGDLPITSLVLGASRPMLTEESGLTIMLRETCAQAVAITRSTVPVRP